MFYVSEDHLSQFLEPEPEDAAPAARRPKTGPFSSAAPDNEGGGVVPDEVPAGAELVGHAGAKKVGAAGGRRPRTLMMRAVDALSRREYSRRELGRKLLGTLREGETPDDVQEVLERLERCGYLNNARYAASRVRSRAARYGNRRLAGELAVMGVERETIAESLENAGDEFERARALWRRKFGRLPQDRRERDRQTRYFVSRGFGFDVIGRLFSGEGLDDEDDFNASP